METVSNMATQAAKMVWGGNPDEKEPISGAQGNVSRGEPFDAGNMDVPPQQNMIKTAADSDRDASTQSNTGTSSLRQDVDSNRQNDSRSEPSTVPATGAGTSKVTGDRESTGDERVSNNRTTEEGASKTPSTDESQVSKSKPKKGSETTSKSTEERDSGKPDGDDGEDGDPKTGAMGDGPKPLDVVAEENGGDAGNNVDSKDKSESDDEGTSSRGNKSKGTGEMHVMTSGFAADGGDFDATKPGAGREADRLMEEKKGGAGLDGTGSDESGNAQDKPSLGDRIKNKLHKH